MEGEGYKATFIRKNQWKYHYFLTKVLHRRRYTLYADKYCRLSIERLRQQLGSSTQNGRSFRFVDRIRKDLRKWDIIRYRYVNQVQESGGIVRTSLTKILDEITEPGYSKWQPNIEIPFKGTDDKPIGITAQILRSLSLLHVDYDAAIAFADQALKERRELPARLEGWRLNTNRYVNKDVYSAWVMSLDAIAEGRFRVPHTCRRTGRVFTEVTNFPRLLRPFLQLDGQPLVGLDVSCSQPLLFGVYLKRNEPTLTSDMEHYLELVQKGDFYPYIRHLLDQAGLSYSLESFKASFFASIFYSKEKRNHPWRTLFSTHFPGVAAAISQAKKVTPERGGQPELLSNALSNLEAEIVIQGVAKRLYAMNFYSFLTVHDAIYVAAGAGMEEVIEQLLLQEYQRHGVTPTVKTEQVPVPEKVCLTK